ncbi:DNA-3-methyladenine glycosylase I [Amphritea sp. 2_MG-2023]|uniref:DNA-3-methyladenine glycosylase I n=1 Tax=Amphritea TaxID=515417 RepID=UPI001C0692D7|nr:DNA-3-methyladenine glycosylase I [Amphritea sp. 2_MG-2023]MBU2966431.1 DNA-3-methyladenine glycosylase I [Amphritea atlantica]MDO6419869.1 DNA-3-methyladenine glycosylase I [Amphritea sp. 2_MG-2023]
MKSFNWIYEHVQAHKAGQDIEALLPQVKSADELKEIGDDRFLSEMSLRVFRAGIRHAVVDAKWPAFELAFFGFDPEKIILMSDDQLENLMQNDQIIRHWGKIKSVRTNAAMITELAAQHGSFAYFIADWPVTDIIGLWALLKKQGQQLGGKSGAYFLRQIGKDTFVLTDDVVAALKAQDIIDKAPTSKRDLQIVQNCFNQWQQESGRPMAHISRLLSYTVGW